MQCACAVFYCHPWPVWFYRIFPHCLVNGTIFGKKKKLLNTKRVFCLSLQLLAETFSIPRRIQRYIMINENRSSGKVPVILVRF